MNMKRIIASILAAIMVVTSVNFVSIGEAFAEAAESTETVSVVESGTAGKNVTWQLDSEGTLTFSGKGAITNYTRDSANDVVNSPFSRNDKIRKVVFGEGITSTGNYLLYDCKSVTEVVLPSTLKTLSAGSLRKCTALEEITIPESVTSMGGHVFMGDTALKKVNLPKKLTKISDNLFNGCSSLEEIIIPETVTSIGSSTFKDCSALTEIHIPENVTSLGTSCFQACSSLEQIIIPNGVTEIKNSTFYKCRKLKEVTLPQELTTMGSSVFYDCDVLEYIDIPKTVAAIGKNAFYGCARLKEIAIPDGVTAIAEQTFSRCSSLADIHIPDSVTSIGANAFRECVGLTEVVLPDGITFIGKEAFRECRYLEKINMPSNLKELSGFALFNCHLLKEVNLPEGLTTLGQYALYCCNSIKDVIVPKSITKIEQYTFYGCRDLEEIVLLGDVTSIGEGAFSGCESMMGMVLPQTVNTIETRAFERCTNLVSIALPEGVTKIEKYAFENCSGLKAVSLSEKTTEIDNYAFSGCNNLNVLTIPKTVQYFGTNILPEKTKIYCHKDSAAETYAKKMGRLYAYVGGGDAENLITGEILNGETNAQWSIDRISGKMIMTWNGVFPDYLPVDLPWKDARAYITSVELYGSVNALTADSFSGCTNMTDLTIYNRNCDLTALRLGRKITIYGFKNSTAERYAKEYGHTFVSIDEKHTHVFDAGEQIKNSTCWEKGVVKYVCTVCCLEDLVEQPILEHQYTTGSKRATLTEDGYVETSCTLCGHTSETILIPKIDEPVLSVQTYAYTGEVQRPEIRINDAQGEMLMPGADYTFEWTTDGKAVGTHSVKITFICDYSGSKTLSYEIEPAKISGDFKLSYTKTTYSGKAKKPTVTISGLTEGKDYTVSYKNNINAGKATVTVTGKGDYTGTASKTFTINKKSIGTKATLSYTKATYSGSSKKPTVKISGLKKSTHYTVSYSNNKNVGKATVKIKGTGNYTGTITKTFTINPKATSITKKPTAAKKAFTVKWKKISTQATGYEIMYATNSKFTKNKKTVKVTSYKTTSKKITKLSAKKTYYVKVRTYKTVNGKKYYSGWSSYKTVKTK